MLCLLALGSARLLAASRRRTRATTRTRIAADRAAKDELFQAQQRPDPGGEESRTASACVLSRSIPRTTRRASLTPSDDRTVIDMPTSTGAPRKMRKAGTLTFTLKGQPMSLTAFVEADRHADHLSCRSAT